jgi:hypothetical protein
VHQSVVLASAFGHADTGAAPSRLLGLTHRLCGPFPARASDWVGVQPRNFKPYGKGYSKPPILIHGDAGSAGEAALAITDPQKELSGDGGLLQADRCRVVRRHSAAPTARRLPLGIGAAIGWGATYT